MENSIRVSKCKTYHPKGLIRLARAIVKMDKKPISVRNCHWCGVSLPVEPTSPKSSPKCEECVKLAPVLYSYGLSYIEYERILDDQGYRCAICNAPFSDASRSKNIDHCHTLNHVRGVLCVNCNLGLGMFKDNTARLRNAIRYLTKNEVCRRWWFQKEWS